MGGLTKLIKQKSQNRLTLLERGHPTRPESTCIEITPEAQELLQPYYGALMSHTEPFTSGIQELSPEDAWVRVLGDQYVLTTYEGFCGADEGVIGVNVAKRVIEQLQTVYGINVD